MLHRVLDDEEAAFGLPSCYRMRGTALNVDELHRVIDDAGPLLSLAQVEHALSQGESPPRGTVLTFDDGYREHLDVVAPMLAGRGASATFYVATGLHGDGAALAPVDAWYWLLDHAESREAAIRLPDGRQYRGCVDTLDGKSAWVGGEPKASFLGATGQQQARMLEDLAATLECKLPADLPAQLYLRPRDWHALVGLGMRLGAHSVTHPRLTQVDDETLEYEVTGSIRELRALASDVAFAYPDGAYDERVVQAVERAGASSSVTCEAGLVADGAGLLCLPRVFVHPKVLEDGAWKLGR